MSVSQEPHKTSCSPPQRAAHRQLAVPTGIFVGFRRFGVEPRGRKNPDLAYQVEKEA